MDIVVIFKGRLVKNFINAVNNVYNDSDADRKLLERSLELSSKELLNANSEMKAVFQAIPDLLFRLDNEGVILDYKAGDMANLLLKPEELIGKRIQNIPLKDIGIKFSDAIQQVLSSKAIVDLEYSLAIQNTNHFYEARLAPLFENQIIAIIRNMTERKRAEILLSNSLHEKDTLLKEIYHRTKNNMQVISSILALQSLTVKDQNARNILVEMENRIYAMSLVHQKLYQSKNLSRVNLKEYISDLAIRLIENFESPYQNISLKLNLESVNVLIDSAVPLGLAINELITNTITYAFPKNKKGTINIKLTESAEHLINLIISDDGIGIPKEYDYKKSDKLGLKILFELVERQLKGNIKFETQHGVMCAITFTDTLYSERV